MWLVVEVNDTAFAIWGAADNRFELKGSPSRPCDAEWTKSQDLLDRSQGASASCWNLRRIPELDFTFRDEEGLQDDDACVQQGKYRTGLHDARVSQGSSPRVLWNSGASTN